MFIWVDYAFPDESFQIWRNQHFTRSFFATHAEALGQTNKPLGRCRAKKLVICGAPFPRKRRRCGKTEQTSRRNADENSKQKVSLILMHHPNLKLGTKHRQNDVTLSASQRRRLTGARLDTTLQSLLVHPAWSSGLGLSDHLTPLKAKCVADDIDDDEMKASLEAVTGFDSRIFANPVKPPQFKKPCALLTGGICHCADHYAQVCRIVEQLHAHLQRIGCEASVPLCCFSAASPQLGSSASSSRPLRPVCRVLGSSGKRWQAAHQSRLCQVPQHCL